MPASRQRRIDSLVHVRGAGPPPASTAPSADCALHNVKSVEIKKILLVKLSSLGDVVHALPVVSDIRAALPGVQIDWVIEKSFAEVLTHCAGLHRVISCDLRRWRKSPLATLTRQAWREFKADLQSEAYDAVIDLQGLTKSALVARLSRLSPNGKRYAMANQTEGSAYEAPTRWVADVAIAMETRIHAVQRSRELAARALGYGLSAAPNFGLRVPEASVFIDSDAMLNIANKLRARTVVFVHGTSRADKEWPVEHWVALGQKLAKSGYVVALAHGSAAEHARSQAIASGLNRAEVVLLPLLSLDALTQVLAASAGVIGVDSGVSHIAIALDLPHVQIYNFDTAWRTGPVGSNPHRRQVSVFAQPWPGVQAVWQAWLGCTNAGVDSGSSESEPAHAEAGAR